MSRFALSLAVLWLSMTPAFAELQQLPVAADRCAIGYALTGRPLEGCAPPEPREAIPRSLPPPGGYAVQFGFDQHQLSDASRAHLDRLASILQGQLTGLCILLRGHADTTGPAQYNMQLSKARAQRVHLYLAGPGQIRQGRLRSEGLGETATFPGLSGRDPRNRRVEILARPSGGSCS